MILSIGVDIVNNERIKTLIDKYGKRFLNKIFTENEINYCMKKRSPHENFAGRFAAKEACVKALSKDNNFIGVYKYIEVVRLKNGFVTYALHKKAKDIFQKLGADRLHLSISHEREFSVAYCIMEKDN